MSDETTPADAPTSDPISAPSDQTATTAVPEAPTEPVAVATSEPPPRSDLPETGEYVALPATEEHVALPEHSETGVVEESQQGSELTPEPVLEKTEQPTTETEETPTEAAPAKKPRKPRAKKKADEDEEALPDATAAADATATEAAADGAKPPTDSKKQWYVVKIQSGREESIKAAIERKVKIEGLEEFYGQIAIPVEEFVEKKKVRVTDKKTGEKVTQEKNVTKARKKYPGYLFAEVEFNDRILYLFRETSGVGDFVGATGPMKPPPPMSDREVNQMLTGVIDPKERQKGPKKTVVKLDIAKGDKVKIRDGAFAGSEGEVKSITEPKDPTDTPKVTVTVTIWGRPVELELDYWHVDKA